MKICCISKVNASDCWADNRHGLECLLLISIKRGFLYIFNMLYALNVIKIIDFKGI